MATCQTCSRSAPISKKIGSPSADSIHIDSAAALKQAFFIGDGRTGTGTGSVQNFVVPAGATRLFLGTSDGVGWFYNSGSFTVTVGPGVGVPTLTPTPTIVPKPEVPMLSLPVLAVLGIALGAAALFLIRRT